MGMNGLDVAGLRPFDLVIPFTIQKGEITGDGRAAGSAPCWEQSPPSPSHCFSPQGEVRMPSGKVAKPDITDNKDGTVTVKYAPTEAGLHEMDIKYDGIHIPGSLVLAPAQHSGPAAAEASLFCRSQEVPYSSSWTT